MRVQLDTHPTICPASAIIQYHKEARIPYEACGGIGETNGREDVDVANDFSLASAFPKNTLPEGLSRLTDRCSAKASALLIPQTFFRN